MLRTVRDIGISALCLCCCFFATEGGLLLRDVRFTGVPKAEQDIDGIASSFSGARQDIHSIVLPTEKAEAAWAAAGLTASQTLAQERNAFSAQQASYEALSEQGTRVLSDVDTTVLSANTEIQGFAPVFAGMAQTEAAATADLSDPSIKNSLANLNTSSQNVADATQHADASLIDLNKAADYELGELMKPVKKIKVIGEEAVRLAGKFLGY